MNKYHSLGSILLSTVLFANGGIAEARVTPGIYRGFARCPEGDIAIQLFVKVPEQGQQSASMSIFPPSYGAKYEVRLDEAPDRSIRMVPTGRIEATGYEIKKYRLQAFGAALKPSQEGLEGVATSSSCSAIALRAPQQISISPEAFGLLTDALIDKMRRPDPLPACRREDMIPSGIPGHAECP